jgi:hypothetical protein
MNSTERFRCFCGLLVILMLMCTLSPVSAEGPSGTESEAPKHKPQIKRKVKPAPKPVPSAKVERQDNVNAVFAFFGTWDRGYNNKERGRVFRPRYWYDLGWREIRGTVAADGFNLVNHRPYRSRQGQVMPEFFSHEEAVGRIAGNTLVELRYTLHRKEPEEEEKAEFIIKDIPLNPPSGDNVVGRVFTLSASHPVTGVVDPTFAGHIVKLEHQITFFDNGGQTTCRLQSANWRYSESGIAGFRQVPLINIMLSR